MAMLRFFYSCVTIFLTTFCAGNLFAKNVISEHIIADRDIVEFSNITLRSVENISSSTRISMPSELIFFPLTNVEDDLAKILNSRWIWSETTLEMINSQSEFLFGTKKSSKIKELKILLQVNCTGRLSGVEIISKVNKRMLARIEYILKKLPDCKPVPGFEKYGRETFELIIKK